MTQVKLEQTGSILDVTVDDYLVLSTGLDLTGAVVLDLADLVDLLEEASDNVVELIMEE